MERREEIIASLNESDDSTRDSFALSLLESKGVFFALQPHGCRVIQAVLELAGGKPRDALAAELMAHTAVLYKSPHGNYVLTKVIDVMPATTVGAIIRELEACGHIAVAKHQFGSRVLDALFAHCSTGQMDSFSEKIIEEAEPLSRHPYGNFAVQGLLEHGTAHQTARLLRQLRPVLPQLAMHRYGSHVVERSLDRSSDVGLAAITRELMQANSPDSIVDVACNRYGSYVVKQLCTLHCNDGLLRRRLAESLEDLVASEFGRRVATHCGLDPGPEPVSAEDVA